MRRTRTVRIGELFDDFFKEPAIARKIAEGALPERWNEIVGPTVAAATRSVSLRNGILWVQISSPALRHELFMRRSFLRDELNRRSRFDLVREVQVK